MRKQLLTFSLLATLASGVIAGADAQTELVTNGGFETGNLTGWSLGGSGGVVSFSDYVHDGDYGFDYNSFGTTSPLTQTLHTTVGATEQISFWQHQIFGGTQEMKVSFGGVQLIDATNLTVGDWIQYTFSVTATAATSVLRFDLRQDTGGAAIDTVSVKEFASSPTTPEGESLLLLGSGLAPLLGVHFWRRRRSA